MHVCIICHNKKYIYLQVILILNKDHTLQYNLNCFFNITWLRVLFTSLTHRLHKIIQNLFSILFQHIIILVMSRDLEEM